MTTDNQWAYDLEMTIFSIVKSRVTENISDKYPNIFITNNSKSTTGAVFPTVYIHELPGSEIGKDLEGTSINGLRETFQVDVTANTSQGDAKKVMAFVAEEFKHLRFEISAMPEFDGSGEVYRSTARFSRVIGANDIL